MIGFLVIGSVLGLVGFGVWRYAYEKVLVARAAELLPGEERIQWFEGGTDQDHERDREMRGPRFSQGMKEAVGVGAVGSMPSLYYLSQVDGTVMDALDFAFAEDLSNFGVLTDYISEKYFDALNTASADGWLTRFEGYVMEMHAMDVLKGMGYEVELADTANQAGFDLLLDGEPWQVKGGQTPQVIAGHFEKYPDIPVITNADLGTSYEGVSNVMVLDDVTALGVHDMTVDGLTSLDQLDSTMGMGIPVVSVIMSSYREVKLHKEQKTDFGSSIKNVGLDAVGVGGGGFAGAQTGALIGAVGGPVGAAVGGVVGGIVGALGGKMATNAVKELAMKEAFSDYEIVVDDAQLVLDMAQGEEWHHLSDLVTEVNTDVNKARYALEHTYRQKFEHDKWNVMGKQRAFLEEVRNLLHDIRKELERVEEKFDRQYERPAFWKRVLVPSYQEIIHIQVKNWFRERYTIVNQAMARFSQVGNGSDEEVQERFKEAVSFFTYYDVQSESLEELLKEVVESADLAHATRDGMKKDFYLHVLRAEETIRHGAKASFSKLAEVSVREKEKIQAAYENYLYERGKLGK